MFAHRAAKKLGTKKEFPSSLNKDDVLKNWIDFFFFVCVCTQTQIVQMCISEVDY